MILLVVDTQNSIVCDELYQFSTFEKDVIKLLSIARENQTEVVYVRHDDRLDQTTDDQDLEIYAGFAPLELDKIFVKNVNSPFRSSGLLEYLLEKEEEKNHGCGTYDRVLHRCNHQVWI